MNRFVTLIVISLLSCGALSAQSLTILSWNLKDFGQSRDDQEIKFISRKAQNVKIVVLKKEII